MKITQDISVVDAEFILYESILNINDKNPTVIIRGINDEKITFEKTDIPDIHRFKGKTIRITIEELPDKVACDGY